MNSDKVAIALTLGIAAVELVILLSKGIDIGSDWLFYLLYAILCYVLFQGLRPIADVITGKATAAVSTAGLVLVITQWNIFEITNTIKLDSQHS